ncbi:MAG: hypothetical protein ACYTGC_08400, partial [Planctomycetota bacterium]
MRRHDAAVAAHFPPDEDELPVQRPYGMHYCCMVRLRFFRLMNLSRFLLTSLLAAAPAFGQADPDGPLFTGLGDLPGGRFSSTVTGVSADGRVVVGSSSGEQGPMAFRWKDGRMEPLGDLPGGRVNSRAAAVSGDGRVVVGTSAATRGPSAFVLRDSILEDLGDIDGASLAVEGLALSEDGRVVAGQRRQQRGSRAWAWLNGRMLDLGTLPDGTPLTAAQGVSADGAVIVGSALSERGSQAFRWSAASVAPLGDLAGGAEFAEATAVSADGRVIVGFSASAFGFEAFRWDEQRGMRGLGGLSDEREIFSYAHAVNGDGTIVVGHAVASHGSSDAFIWDPINGLRSLRDALVHEFGIGLFGWTLTSAEAISRDGRTIAGNGMNPEGQNEGWVVRLPPTATRTRIAGAALPPVDRDDDAWIVYRATIDGLREPRGVRIDAAGRVVVVDAGAAQVLRCDRDGVRLDTWGPACGDGPPLVRPVAIALLDDGHCVVVDAGADRLVRLDASGRAVGRWAVRTAAPLADIAVARGWGYLVRHGDPRVLAFSMTQLETPGAGEPTLLCIDVTSEARQPSGLAVDAAGAVFLTDGAEGQVLQHAIEHGFELLCGGWGTAPGLFRGPAGLAVHDDLLHVIDRRNHRVQVLDRRGSVRAIWGRPSLRPREGQGRLHDPHAIAIAPGGGFLVVSEPREGRCQVFDRIAIGAEAARPALRADPAAAERRFFGPSIAAAGELIAVTVPDRDAIELFV